MVITRCSNSPNSSLLKAQAIEKKIKYDKLLDDIQRNNPGLKIALLTFAVGYLGSIIEDDFHAHLTSLGVPEQAHPVIVHHSDSIRLRKDVPRAMDGQGRARPSAQAH